MQLDNKEAFKKWLIETLNPICEAEPDTLASYIVALVKKDRTEADLIELCCRELEVFLLDETKRFVKKLFEALRSKSYLGKSEAREEKGKQKMQLTHYKSLPKRDQENIEESRGLTSLDSSKQSREGWPRTTLSSRLGPLRRSPDHHRTRSRGASHRTLESSHSRNRSPPIRLAKRPPRDNTTNDGGDDDDDGVVSITSSRKRNHSDSSGNSANSRSRYWRSRQESPPSTTPFKQKCPPGDERVVLDNSPYVSQSFDNVPVYIPQPNLPNLTKPPPALPFTPQYASRPIINPLPPSFKLPPPQPIQYVPTPYQLPQQPSMQENYNQYHPEPYVPMPARFNQPPPLLSSSATYISNNNNVSSNNNNISNNNNNVSSNNDNNDNKQINNLVEVNTNDDDGNDTNLYNNDNTSYLNNNNPNIYDDNNPYNPTTNNNNTYNPSNNNPYNNTYNNPTISNNDLDDDEVSVSSRRSVKRAASDLGVVSQAPAFKQTKKTHDGNNQAGKKGNAGSYQYVPNTVLELRRVPAEDNTITNINAHFSKFGIIVNLQINFDNDPSAALVAFASAAQASAAHKSKEPFLNNRFIRIFWHNPEKTASNNAGGGGGGAFSSAQDKQALQKMKTHVTIPERHLLTLDNTKKKGSAASSSGGQTNAEAGGEEGGAEKKKVVVPPRSALKLQRNHVKEPNRKIDKTSPRAMDLKGKKANLGKLLQYSKLLSTLFENATDHEERKQLSMKMESNMRYMKSLQDDIKRLSRRVPIQAPGLYKLNRKAVVGKELKEAGEQETGAEAEDETHKNSERQLGEHSRNPFKKINKAPSTITSVAPLKQPSKTLLKVDRRPRELLVTGFPANEQRINVLSHMKLFGEIEKSGYIEQPPSLLVTFKYRGGAEKALSLGCNYKNSNLKIMWWDNLINKINNNNNNNKISEKNMNNNNKDDNEGDVNKENKHEYLLQNIGNNKNNNNNNSDLKTNTGANDIPGTLKNDDSVGGDETKVGGDETKVGCDYINDGGNDNADDKGGDEDNKNDDGDDGGDDDDDGKGGKEDAAWGGKEDVAKGGKDVAWGGKDSAWGGKEDAAKGGKDVAWGGKDSAWGGKEDVAKGGKEDTAWAGKDAAWMQHNYFDDFHQNLDYEEDEASDEKLLEGLEDEEEEEEEEDDGGRSWRR